jgi:hypothetical protein
MPRDYSVPRQERVKVRPEGFEPPTLGSEDRCSIQLSYGRVVCSCAALAICQGQVPTPANIASLAKLAKPWPSLTAGNHVIEAGPAKHAWSPIA